MTDDSKAGYGYWEIDKYPPELQALARVLVEEEHSLSDGYRHYLGFDEDAGPMLPILRKLLEAIQ